MARIACKTPGCPGTEFSAHQVVRMDVVVDDGNNFQRNRMETAEASMYDAGKPYGPYTCTTCGAEAIET